MNKIKSFIRSENGATMVEYGLIAALMSAAIVVVLSAFGDDLLTSGNTVGTNLSTPADITQ
ncbi:MAG: Flp family type IVb pilin [Alphaproteobacteria bacterium]